MGNNSTSSVDSPTSKTSSRCLTECVTTAHDFEVIRYSLLEGMGAGKYVSSSTFTVSGYGWNIRMYPDGWKEEHKGAYMSAFLCFCSGTTEAKVKFTLSLWEKDGKVCELKSTECTFLSLDGYQGDAYWGWDKFIDKPKL
jgi:speckle-type POZ protein